MTVTAHELLQAIQRLQAEGRDLEKIGLVLVLDRDAVCEWVTAENEDAALDTGSVTSLILSDAVDTAVAS